MNNNADLTRANDRPLEPPAYVAGAVPVTTAGETDEMDEMDETAEIRGEIEQTRADLSETINAIQEKLNPQTLVEQAKDSVREGATNMVEQAKETVREATIGKAEQMVTGIGETARGTGSSIMETIRQNPVPTALAAIGIGWLWMNRSTGASGHNGSYRGDYTSPAYAGTRSYGTSTPSYGAGTAYSSLGSSGAASGGQDTVRQTLQQVQDKAGQLAGQAQSGVSQLAEGAQSGMSQLAEGAQSGVTALVETTQQQAQQAQGQLQQMLHETPLAVGGIALALGAAVGLAIPETPPEHQLMGGARDTLVQKAQETAQDTMQKVQGVAQKVGSAAIDTAKDEAQSQGLTPR